MKITVVSDLHLEFVQGPVIYDGADVLILSGDILVADHLTRGEGSPYQKHAKIYEDFIDDCMSRWPQVIFVMGNHEHYHGRFEKTASIIREKFEGPGFTLLDNQYTDFGDVRFIGTTLWTDCNREDPMTMMHMRGRMNDYRCITTLRHEIYRKLNVEDTLMEHKMALAFIDEASRDHERCVVIGHHGPTPLSISPEFKNDRLGNGGYVSNLYNFILDRPQIKIWTHGHVHSSHDYMVGDTRVVCNPHGYPHEDTGFQSNFLIDVPN